MEGKGKGLRQGRRAPEHDGPIRRPSAAAHRGLKRPIVRASSFPQTKGEGNRGRSKRTSWKKVECLRWALASRARCSSVLQGLESADAAPPPPAISTCPPPRVLSPPRGFSSHWPEQCCADSGQGDVAN